MKRLLILLLLLVALLAAAFGGSTWFIQQAAKGRVYDRIDIIPFRDVGLVLGTSRLRRDGGDNPYFQYRIQAAAKLYHAGKVKHLLLSGDNHINGYNEPEDMRRALIADQVPDSVITLDYAGLRTLDSIVRAKKIFGLDSFTIISQREHDQRALLIAKYYGVNAIAYAADDVSFQYAKMSHIHEWLADIKVILDLYILHTPPKHLGQREVIH